MMVAMDDSASGSIGCVAVSNHISRPVPEILWHYTTFAGFQGIINSKKIWATEYRFLNDREEFKHAKKLALEVIDEESELPHKLFSPRDLLRRSVELAFNTGPFDEKRLRLMVASFSERGDQLSQWRGYSGNSTGVSIGLDLRGLRPPADTQPLVTFAPCVYSEEKKRTLLKAVFEHFRTGLQEWEDSIIAAAAWKAHEGKRFEPRRSRKLNHMTSRRQWALLIDLLRIGPLLKDRRFSEEREWRLVLPSDVGDHPTEQQIEFRPIRDALVPYIAYPLFVPTQGGEISCRSVILGPGAHASAEGGVNTFLRGKLIPVSAQPSKIPYRPA